MTDTNMIQTSISLPQDMKAQLELLSFKLSQKEGKRVSEGEILRRGFNIYLEKFRKEG